MKKCIIYMLIALLIAVSFPMTPAEANAASVSIPVTTGVIGNDGSAKTFLLDLPSNVVSSSLSTSSLKYVGSNELVGGISIENGKIKVTLKGVSNPKTIEVNGYESGNNRPFITNIGNSIWRYSDGRRWQINDYNPTTNLMDKRDKNAEDSTMPSERVPITIVNAKSSQNTAGRYWYTDTGEKIDSQYIVSNTIQTVLVDKSSYVKEVKFPNGNIITSYKIPVDEKDRNWEDVTDTATMPITQHVQGRFYSASVRYYYKATAKLTSYSYGGKITFDYSPPTEPTLDGRVSVVAPSPNPAKDEGKDIPVTLKITGDLLAYTDTSNIMEWVFYARETEVPTGSTKKDTSKVLTSSRAFDNLVIPKSKFAGGDYEQEYTVTVTVRFNKAVETPGGSVTSLSKTMKAKVGVSKTPIILPVPPSGGNKPPVAVLDIPDSVMAGEEFLVYGKDSYDPDGVIVSYKYSASDAMVPVTGEYGFTWYPLSLVGKRKSINLQVEDNGGLGNATSAKIEITAPIPEARIKILGTKKENRKVTLHNASVNAAEHFPIVDEKTRFTIEAISGGAAGDIKYSGTLNGINDKDMVFKKAGTYKATIYVENNVGYSDTTSITFDIVPDEPPVVYFAAPGRIYRDPTNGNVAPAALTDMSFSPDYDFLGHRKWEYRYDAENDGDFSNNSWVTFSDANLSALTLSLSQVGRYEVRLTVTEEFDQPTIDEFVTAADRRSRDSYNSVPAQPLAERVIEVYNRAPVVDWSW